MKERFLICEICGNIIGRIHDAGVEMVCCGVPMKELEPNVKDAAHEKHVPVISHENDKIKVKVGEVDHPMTAEHSITWIYLETAQGGQRKQLQPGAKPEACFALCNDEAQAVYAYCNLHGLWKAPVK